MLNHVKTKTNSARHGHASVNAPIFLVIWRSARSLVNCVSLAATMVTET